MAVVEPNSIVRHGRAASGSGAGSHLPVPLLFVFVAAALMGLASANPLLTAAAILAVPIFLALLWRPGEPPVLLFAVGFQWTQVTAKIFQANVQGVSVTELAQSGAIELVLWLGLSGLVVLALGMRLGIHRLPVASDERLSSQVSRISIEKAFIFYLAATTLATALRGVAWAVPGFTQPILALAGLRWAFFFLLGYLVLKRRQRYLYFFTAIGIEFIAGIGFFSGFKTVVFVTLLVVFTTHSRIDVRTVVWGTVGVLVLLLIGSAWTVVKPEYRSFVNQGSGMQRLEVSRSDQVAKLASLVGSLSRADLAEGMDPLFNRLSYTDYFAYTVEYVPEVVPHEGGELWKASIAHIFKPRMLFPDKPRLPSASELTMQYTGLHMASGAEGTSISIGYMGESYIDFGPYWMFVPIFLLGILWGLIYRFLISYARFAPFGFGVAMTVLMGAYLFEAASIMLLGGMLMSFIVAAIVLKWGEPFVMRWLVSGDSLPDRVPLSRGSTQASAI